MMISVMTVVKTIVTSSALSVSRFVSVTISVYSVRISVKMLLLYVTDPPTLVGML